MDIISPGFFWPASWGRLILALSSSSFSAGVWQQKPSFHSRSSFLCDSFCSLGSVCPLTSFYSLLKYQLTWGQIPFLSSPMGIFFSPCMEISPFTLKSCSFLWILLVAVHLNNMLWKKFITLSKDGWNISCSDCALIIIKTLFFGGRNYFSFFEPPPNMNCALPLLLLFLDAIGCCQFLNSNLCEIADWCFWLQNIYFLYSHVWEWIEQMQLDKGKSPGNVWPGITEVLVLSTEDHGCNAGLLLEHIVHGLYSQKKVVNSLLSTFVSYSTL